MAGTPGTCFSGVEMDDLLVGQFYGNPWPWVFGISRVALGGLLHEPWSHLFVRGVTSGLYGILSLKGRRGFTSGVWTITNFVSHQLTREGALRPRQTEGSFFLEAETLMQMSTYVASSEKDIMMESTVPNILGCQQHEPSACTEELEVCRACLLPTSLHARSAFARECQKLLDERLCYSRIK